MYKKYSLLKNIFVCGNLMCFNLYSTDKFGNIPDPFFPEKQVKNNKEQHIVLCGIVQTATKQCAILSKGESREVIAKGELFLGYTLSSIQKNSVTLCRGKTTIKLYVE